MATATSGPCANPTSITATQDSRYVTLGIDAEGEYFGGGGQGASNANFEFSIDEAADYTLDGSIFGEGGTLSEAQIQVVHLFPDIELFNFETAEGDSGSFFVSGTLSPGTYRVLGRAAGTSGDAAFNFQFRLVPEPSVALLLIPGLAALVWRVRRELGG